MFGQRFLSRLFSKVLTGICLITGVSLPAIAEDPVNITLSTGSVSGVYYPTGGAICRVLNKSQRQHHIRCTVTSSEGSLLNIQRLQDKSADVAIVQSDIQQHAYNGDEEFATSGPMPQLRALFSLYTEAFTIVARADSGIQNLYDLQQKKVDIGNPGSGERVSMDHLMTATGWTKDSFTYVSELKADDRAQALCDGKIDAFVYMVGHPSGVLREATNSCDTKLISVPTAVTETLLKTYPEYATVTIPGGLYHGNDVDIHSFGVTATLLTTDSLDEDVAYEIVKSTMENLLQLERTHQALKNLVPEKMAHSGITVPLHRGAMRYYQEAKIPML